MDRIKNILRKWWPEVLLGVLLLIAYHTWVIPGGYLVAGDWSFHFKDFLHNFFGVPRMWEAFNSLGHVDIIASYDPLKYLYGLLSTFVDFNLSERLVYFWPILLFSYGGVILLGRKIFKADNVAVFFFGILFCFNTFILSIHTSFISYAAAYALTPTIFYLVNELLKQTKISLKFGVLGALTIWVAYIYESRAVIALSYLLGIFFLYSVFTASKDRLIKLGNFVLMYVVFSLMALFSLVPLKFLLTGAAATTATLFVPYTRATDALALHNYSWQGDIFSPFMLVPFLQTDISGYFYAVTALIFLPNIMDRKYRPKIYGFLVLASVIGIFLLKQQNAPLGQFYNWAFHPLPTFNLFRESNKFILFMLPISLLFGFSVSLISRKLRLKSVKFVVLSLAALLVLINLKPILTKEIGTLFVTRKVPAEYLVVHKFISEQQPFFRTFWAPAMSRWAIQDNQHPALNSGGLISNEWQNLFKDILSNRQIADEMRTKNALQVPVMEELLRISNVKYIFVPMSDTVNEEYPYWALSQGDYLAVLDRLPWLKRVNTGTDHVVAYENKNSSPYFFTFTNLIKFPSMANLELKQRMASEKLGTGSVFTSSTEKVPGITVTDMFEDLDKVIGGGPTTSASTKDSEVENIVINTEKSELSYAVENKTLTLRRRNYVGLRVDNKTFGPQDDKITTIGSLRLQSPGQYLVGLGEKLIPVDDNVASSHNLGTSYGSPVVYRVDSQNRVRNSGLEDGLWSNSVEDCNNYNSI